MLHALSYSMTQRLFLPPFLIVTADRADINHLQGACQKLQINYFPTVYWVLFLWFLTWIFYIYAIETKPHLIIEQKKKTKNPQFSKRNAFAKTENHSDSRYNCSHIISLLNITYTQGFSDLSWKMLSKKRSFSIHL